MAWWTFAAAVLAALVVVAVSKIDLHQVGRSLDHVRAGWVAAAVALMVATFLARGESWYAALRAALPGERLNRFTVTRVLLIGIFGSAVAPGRLGEAARAWLITRRLGKAPGTLAKVIGTLVSQSFLNLVVLLILAAIALAGGAIPGAHTGAIAATAAVPAAILLGLMLGPKLVSSFASVERGPVGRALAWLSGQLGEVGRGMVVFRRLRTMAHSAGFQLLGWALQTGACYAVIVAFGFQNKANVATAAAILFAVNVTAVVPITPSNVGVFQAACIGVLAPLGIQTGTALAYGLVLQAIEIVCAAVLGIPSLLREGLSVGDLRRQGSLREPASEMSGGDATTAERAARHPA